jgi:glycerophosphoryl diester phosphodiesterase
VAGRLAWVVRGWLDFPRQDSRARRGVWVVGHRGAPRAAVENTVGSFSTAIALGADAIETDVCATRDGRFVLWHDADPDERVALARQVGIEGLAFQPRVPAVGSSLRRPVRELDWSELHEHYGYVSCHGGGTPAGGREAPVETLEDLLGWARRESRVRHIFFDLKLAEQDAGAASALFDRLRRDRVEGGLDHAAFHLLSPRREIVRALIEEARVGGTSESLRISADFELPGVVREAPATGARDVSMGCGERLWNGFRCEVCRVVGARDRGIFDRVVVWTVNEPRRLKDLLRCGVDGILTDDPEGLRRVLAEEGDGDEVSAGISAGMP